ncbi:MAG: hypothetical protein L3J39_07200 [Verrucomicrobiales bacterium]|nr:hypothetical protein [Verrucomicrobiales bacterium]
MKLTKILLTSSALLATCFISASCASSDYSNNGQYNQYNNQSSSDKWDREAKKDLHQSMYHNGNNNNNSNSNKSTAQQLRDAGF